MIFGLQYALVVAGYAATAFLLGNYMILYTGASQLELGLIFTIQPAVIVVRPIVCSLADRFQSHRAIYLYCSLLSFLCHLPFIAVPFIVEAAEGRPHNRTASALQEESLGATLNGIFTERARFWLLVVSHFAGCVFFCCMRTLGDVLTVNHCRRIGTNYTKYRRLAPISFGMCSLVLGYINCNEQLFGLPDYVSGFILYSACHMTLCVLFYLWPEEFFEIVSEDQVLAGRLRPLPSSAEVRRHMKRKLLGLVGFKAAAAKQRLPSKDDKTTKVAGATSVRRISTMQQVRILAMLFKQDFRIPLYLLVLVGCGVMGHSVQNFVYVYLAEVCRRQGCSSSTISGYIMLGICVTETAAYTISCHYFTFQQTRKNKLVKVELGLIVLAAHYLVLALLVNRSAYFFLVEAFHGFEFGLMIATCIELGDHFASEVALIIPQLQQRRIISETDDLGLVRVSLVATMLACFLLAYDGLGGIVGGLLFGLVVDRLGFVFAFQLNATLSMAFLVFLLLFMLLARQARVKPEILRHSPRACCQSKPSSQSGFQKADLESQSGNNK